MAALKRKRPKIDEKRAKDIRVSVADALSPLVRNEKERLNIVDSVLIEIFEVPLIPQRGDIIERWLLQHRSKQTNHKAQRAIDCLLKDYIEHATHEIPLDRPL